jgi:hypothetical protein
VVDHDFSDKPISHSTEVLGSMMEQVDMISTMRRLLSVTKQVFFTEQKGPGTTEIMRSFIILFICTYIYNDDDDDDMYIYMMMMMAMMMMVMMVMMVTMMMMICTYIYI